MRVSCVYAHMTRESILPYVKPSRSQDVASTRARAFLSGDPHATVTSLRNICARRSVPSAMVKEEGVLERQGSPCPGVWAVHPLDSIQ